MTILFKFYFNLLPIESIPSLFRKKKKPTEMLG